MKKQKTLLKPLACSDLSLVLQAASGRQRRRAVFGTADLTPPAAPSDEEEEEEEEEDEEEEKDVGKDMEARQQSGSSAESSGRDDSDAESDESEGESLPIEPCFGNLVATSNAAL